MSNLLTTISILIVLGIAIETTSLSIETTVTVEACGDPIGTLPPPQ
ncbi:MAG: hypothetical protein WDA22_11180 [Bacteroidota bacterium]